MQSPAHERGSVQTMPSGGAPDSGAEKHQNKTIDQLLQAAAEGDLLQEVQRAPQQEAPGFAVSSPHLVACTVLR